MPSKRKNQFLAVRQSAKQAVINREGIGSCPYKNASPYRAHWIWHFGIYSQGDWVKTAAGESIYVDDFINSFWES